MKPKLPSMSFKNEMSFNQYNPESVHLKFVLKKHENENFHEKNKPSEKAVKDLKDCVLASILQRPKSVFHSILPADFRKMGDF